MTKTIRAARYATNGSASALRKIFEAVESAFEMKKAFNDASSVTFSAGSIERLRCAAERN